MTRETLQSILRAAEGLTDKAGAFRVPSEHRVTFYLGNEGRGIVVNEVEEIKLADDYLQLTAPEPGQVFTPYAAVYAVSIKPPKPNAPKKAGFA
ncbi:MAG: hypothetical protein QM778_05070 [Myxococcales bacterium]